MNKSFTLIEILVVIVVIGVLSAFILVGMTSITNSANITKSKTFSNSIRNSLLTNLVSEWKLDGNANDSWGANSGTLVGPTHLPVLKTTNDCVSGTCYEFDGTEDYISIGDKDNLSFTDNIFTFSVWFKLYTNNNLGILGKRGAPWEYSIFTRTANIMRCYTWVSSGASAIYSASTAIETNKWTHLVWTSDGSKAYLYKNSLYVGSVNKTSDNLSNTTSPFEIGRGGDASGYQCMNGLLDEVTIYNGYSSSSQIRESFYSGINKLYKNKGISLNEFNQRLAELKSDLVNNE